MSHSGGDLPRSPTGRVPQWVVDEASGLPTQDSLWRPTTPAAPWPSGAPQPVRTRRRRRPVPTAAWVLVVATVAGAAWWGAGTLGSVPDGAPLPPHAAPGRPAPAAPEAAPAPLPQEVAPPPAPEPPSADVAALADEAFLSEEGRELFFGARPEILGAGEFAGRCERHTPRSAPTGAVGCFDGRTIVVYAPADARLRGSVVETVAHETLHAAWEVLPPAQRQDLTALLEAEIARQPADAPIHEQLAGSVGATPENRPTELFAYIGTQVWREGGLAPDLERVYARFVADRAALVGVHVAWRGMLDGLLTGVETAQRALVDRQSAFAQQRAQHQADTASVSSYRQAYQEQSAEFAAMPPEEQQRLQLSWQWWDGTPLPMAPAAETLARAAELLARDDAALATRAAALGAEESALAAERARVEGLIADYEALTAQLVPPGS